MKEDNEYKTKILQSLIVGDTVSIQNQTGNQPKKWNSTGRIVEVLPHRKYRVLKDGSQRVTDRNRKFLKRIPNILGQGKHPNLPLKSSVETNSRSVTQTVQRNNLHLLLCLQGTIPRANLVKMYLPYLSCSNHQLPINQNQLPTNQSPAH